MAEATRGWDVTDVAVACSGNFTVERVLHAIGRGFRLHSNDVSIYSCTLGRYLTGAPIDVQIADAYRDEFGWLTPYLQEPAHVVATLMLATRMLDGLGRETPYHERMRHAYRDQWERMHAQTVAKVEALVLPVVDFHAGDGVEWVRQLPEDWGLVSFPPFFASGYEKLYENMERVFAWDKPDYPEIDDERLDVMFEAIRKRKTWIVSNNHRRPDLEPHLVGIVRPSNLGSVFYVYASGAHTRVVMPHQETAPVPGPRLMPGMTLGDRLALAPLTAAQFNGIRASYLNPAIAPASPDLALAVLVDGVTIGCYAMLGESPSFLSYDKYLPGPHVYLLSDFAVAPTDEPKLSKLVLMAMLSREGQLLAERLKGRRVRSVTTTAFTDRPVSMKYRGLFELLTRVETPDAGWNYQLTYGARLGQWSLAEAMDEWRRKHAKPALQVAG